MIGLAAIIQTHTELATTPWVWRRALRQADLPASAFRAGLALIDEFMNRETGKTFPSFEKIAEASKMPPRTVRAGIDALRKQGLLFTRKSRFDGSLDFFLAVPDTSRSDINLPVRTSDEVTQIGRTKRQKSVARSDIFLPVEGAEICHLTSLKEPTEVNLPNEPEGIARSPADDAFGGLRFTSTLSSLRSDSSASVDRKAESGDAHLQKKEEIEDQDLPIACPPSHPARVEIITQLAGKHNGKAAHELLSRLTLGTLTKRIAGEIIAAAEAEAV